MKICQKCQKEHEKPGRFCSRSCANARVFTAEAIQKKSEANKKSCDSPEARQQRSALTKEYWEQVRVGKIARSARKADFGLKAEQHLKKLNLTKEQFIDRCSKLETSAEARKGLVITEALFKKIALHFCCFKPARISLEDILSGKVKYKQTHALKLRLLRAGIKQNKCERKGCTIGPLWLGEPIVCELHHKDGNSANNRQENLEMLCPNCHSQTYNYCLGHRRATNFA